MASAKKSKMPQVLYVRRDDEDGETLYLASELLNAAVYDGSTTVIGTYTLSSERTYVKVVQEVA